MTSESVSAVSCPDPSFCYIRNSCQEMGKEYIGDCTFLLMDGICCQEKSTVMPTPTNVFPTAPAQASSSSTFQYRLLEGIFSGQTGRSVEFMEYLQSIYRFAIWVVGIAALLMISIGGFMYVTSAGNQSNAQTAKRLIRDALIGLIVILLTWILLNLINPDLVNPNLESIIKLRVQVTSDIPAGRGLPGDPDAPLPPPGGSGGDCNGLALGGIKPEQCNDVSAELGDFLKCLQGVMPGATITSVSDNEGFDRCQNNWSDPPCAHSKNSCHYGGAGKNSKSCAVDIRTRGVSGGGNAIIQAARNGKCGHAKAYNEGNHVHFSVPGCSCDGHN